MKRPRDLNTARTLPLNDKINTPMRHKGVTIIYSAITSRQNNDFTNMYITRYILNVKH